MGSVRSMVANTFIKLLKIKISPSGDAFACGGHRNRRSCPNRRAGENPRQQQFGGVIANRASGAGNLICFKYLSQRKLQSPPEAQHLDHRYYAGRPYAVTSYHLQDGSNQVLETRSTLSE